MKTDSLLEDANNGSSQENTVGENIQQQYISLKFFEIVIFF